MKKNILCIDDTSANLFTLRSVIESAAGELYDVVTVRSAMDGLAILLRQKIDLILLDVMMPEIDGFDAAKMIKSNKKTKHIPILFLTAKKDDDSIEKCYHSGGDDYINKPFNDVELLARISFHLRLKEKSKLLQQEKEYAQNIIDLQENIILVSDGKEVLTLNNALLTFYKIENILDFKKRYKCVCHTFVVEDNYFNLEELKEPEKWIDKVIELSQTQDVVVKIIRDGAEHIFNINAVVFQENYIVTLTDITQISQLSQEYEYEANIDALTEIYNRNMFQRVISRKIIISQKEKKSFIFILFDIDFFKKVNDIHGHLVGDSVLRNIAILIKKHIRDSDLFARWGGEEFVLAFDVDMDRGVQIAESLRRHIEMEDFAVVKDISCSFGITEFKVGDTINSLTKRADNALYQAKEQGRNRVCQI